MMSFGQEKIYGSELTVIWNHPWLIINCNKRNRHPPLRVIMYDLGMVFFHMCWVPAVMQKTLCIARHEFVSKAQDETAWL